jgi:hypothetical protein
MRLVNLTPHPIVIQLSTGERMTFEAEKPAARVVCKPNPVGEPLTIDVNDRLIPVNRAQEFGAVENIPEPREGVGYIVSGMVLARCFGRTDVFGPATGPMDGAIRDEKGNIIAVTRLVAAPEGSPSDLKKALLGALNGGETACMMGGELSFATTEAIGNEIGAVKQAIESGRLQLSGSI